ncbi:hypothetical protein CMQ_2800 [Grosmannia clavigera kw1407]|uniref:Uncharacterized protein n=1 Tax=Grosmannia clavigera (strain kw1407 / UAMH 11150) TaxID=655863 RepID=F0XH95_GROCL|nr:uncharacterized protein CMQ_2800 [Grosmannia clavigera kw1407]EFX02871.1 hypothetical protein CMQ_2800 [Grosmannia clavigera kw1407]
MATLVRVANTPPAGVNAPYTTDWYQAAADPRGLLAYVTAKLVAQRKLTCSDTDNIEPDCREDQIDYEKCDYPGKKDRKHIFRLG